MNCGTSAKATRSTAGAATTAAVEARKVRRATRILNSCTGVKEAKVKRLNLSIEARRTVFGVGGADNVHRRRLRRTGLRRLLALLRTPLVAAIRQVAERQAYDVGDRPERQNDPRIGDQERDEQHDGDDRRPD